MKANGKLMNKAKLITSHHVFILKIPSKVVTHGVQIVGMLE